MTCDRDLGSTPDAQIRPQTNVTLKDVSKQTHRNQKGKAYFEQSIRLKSQILSDGQLKTLGLRAIMLAS